MKKINIVKLIIALALPLFVGFLSALLSAKEILAYSSMLKPPLSPPGWLFSVAWTILYLVMGLASFFLLTSNVPKRTKVAPIALYLVGLVLNFFWCIIFFNLKLYLFSFIWLVALFLSVAILIAMSIKISKKAAFLLIPYALWLMFAGYLNFGAFILNSV